MIHGISLKEGKRERKYLIASILWSTRMYAIRTQAYAGEFLKRKDQAIFN